MYEKEVLEIARQILVKNDDWYPDYVVGIVGPGVIPAAMLAEYLEVKFHTLDVESEEMNCWMAEEAYGYIPEDERDGASLLDMVKYSKRILIVDALCRTGETFEWIKKDWPSGCLPQDTDRWNEIWHDKVRFASAHYNLRCKFDVDYHGESISMMSDARDWDKKRLLKKWWN